MESSLFKELIHALTTAKQNQHQVLVMLSNEQEQRFKPLLQAQQEMFWNLLALVGTPATVSAGSPLCHADEDGAS